jgi:hypothetical protein
MMAQALRAPAPIANESMLLSITRRLDDTNAILARIAACAERVASAIERAEQQARGSA